MAAKQHLSGISPTDADVRLVGLMANGYDNILWYNFKKYNGRDPKWIIEDLERRFMEYAYKNRLLDHLQVLQYYDNRTNTLLLEKKKEV